MLVVVQKSNTLSSLICVRSDFTLSHLFHAQVCDITKGSRTAMYTFQLFLSVNICNAKPQQNYLLGKRHAILLQFVMFLYLPMHLLYLEYFHKKGHIMRLNEIYNKDKNNKLTFSDAKILP